MIDCLSASPDPAVLTVTWENGVTSRLSAQMLRREAMDAGSKAERFHKGEVAVAEGLWITGIHPVGGFGVNLHFSDGHDRAIFPFAYLRELSERFDK